MKILIVEDEPDILTLLEFNVQNAGFTPIKAIDGTEALDKVRLHKPDLIVLDLMLPGMDGLDVCKALKAEQATRNIPIIMLTARGEEVDRIVGFELGADDYVVKPFSPRELILRIKAILRRNEQAEVTPESWDQEGLYVDFDAYTLKVDEQDAKLTATEFRLLAEFIKNQGRVLSRDYLLSKVWGYEFEGYARTVDTHIRRLRKKMEPYSEILETVRGVGYRLR